MRMMPKLLAGVALLLTATLSAAPAMAKKNPQGQGQPQSYGPPSYAGPKGTQAPPYGPPSYAGPKTNAVPQGMPPGQQKKYSKHKKKQHRNGPPDQAPAWGYRNQQ